MIDYQKTLEILSIDCASLKHSSVVKVYWRCDRCGTEKLKPYRDCVNSTGLCSRCHRERQGYIISNKFGKTQQKQGRCIYCGTSIRSQLKTCELHRRQHLSVTKTGKNNPAWKGASVCSCGRRKSHNAISCRDCSFKSGRRSGVNNGRWIKDRGLIVAARIARTLLNNTVRCLGIKKDTRTSRMIGYSFEDLKRHIESQFEPWMTWDNYGIESNQWSIDHIIPVSVLVKHGITDPAVINALWNLRPMRTSDNIKKSNEIDSSARALALQKLNLHL